MSLAEKTRTIRLNSEQERIIDEACKKVEKSFNNSDVLNEKISKVYEDILKMLDIIKGNISGGEYEVTEKFIPVIRKKCNILIKEGDSLEIVLEKTKPILNYMENMGERKRPLYQGLLKLYDEFNSCLDVTTLK